MDRDNYADMFRFPMGACVRWAESPRARYYIYQRRWTQRAKFSTPSWSIAFGSRRPGPI